MLLFPPKNIRSALSGLAAPLSLPRFVRWEFRYTSPCVSLQSHEENRQRKPVFPPVPAIYAMQRSSQPPDPRTYSAEVTSSSEQSPASSQTARSFHAPYYTTTACCQSQSLFPKNLPRISDKIPRESRPVLVNVPTSADSAGTHYIIITPPVLLPPLTTAPPKAKMVLSTTHRKERT